MYNKRGSEMGRTSVVLDDRLVDQCVKATGIGTRRALIDHARQELLRHERQKQVLELQAKVPWEGDLETWRQARG
jgi:Arc/MetJ family transcription regulator